MVLPTFLIMFGYFPHDLSLSFGFLSLVCAAPIVHFLYKLYRIRCYFQKRQRDDLVGSRAFPPQSLKVQILIARRANGPPPSAFRAPPRHQQGSFGSTARFSCPVSPLPDSSPVSISRPGILSRHVTLCAPFPRRNFSDCPIPIHAIRITPAQSYRCTEVPSPYNWRWRSGVHERRRIDEVEKDIASGLQTYINTSTNDCGRVGDIR